MISKERREELKGFLKKNKIFLEDYELINMSLTHPSYFAERSSQRNQHNQRLEFLGDAVVGLVIADYLYEKFPDKNEGALTKMRAAVVCKGALAAAARKIKLGDYLLLGRGELLGGGRDRSSNLADAWEALCGAIYLEKGLDYPRDFIVSSLKETLDLVSEGNFGDYKTRLQEIIQKESNQELEYVILSERGPDHDKTFEAGLLLNSKLISQGNGKTKKEAEQEAARQALEIWGK